MSRFVGALRHRPLRTGGAGADGKPGTPLAEIEAVLAQRRQHLAFEPGDLGEVLDGGGGSRSNIRGTLGGAVACNLAGPRRH